MKNDFLYKKIYTEILEDEDEELFILIKHILDLDILKNYYSAPIFYAQKPNKEVYIAAKEESLLKEFEYFKNKIFSKKFFKDYIILDYLPYSVKAVTTNFMRIIYNFSRKGVKFIHLFTDYYNEKDLKIVNHYYIILLQLFKGYFVITILHEINHFIRKLKGINLEDNNEDKVNKKSYEVSSGEKFSSEKKNEILYKEGGKNLIYYLFGKFVITHIDINYSKLILDKNNWDNVLSVIKKNLPNDNSLVTQYFSGLKFCETYEKSSERGLGCRNDDIDIDNKKVSKFIWE